MQLRTCGEGWSVADARLVVGADDLRAQRGGGVVAAGIIQLPRTAKSDRV